MRAAPGEDFLETQAMDELLLQKMPPDPDLVDLIEEAFLSGQIDGETEDLASIWLRVNHHHRQ